MRRQYVIICLAFIVAALFLAGCADKTADNPTKPVINEKGLVFTPWAPHFEPILISANGDGGSKGVAVYVPYGYNPNQASSHPYPTLYLLTPFKSTELYYFKRDLATVADRLIEEGKIQPMIIVCVEGSSLLGASFYTNSLAQGHFFTAFFKDTTIVNVDHNGVPETVIGKSLISRIDLLYPTITSASERAIGGVGVGGYGAFKAAIQTDLFSAVSAINAPLDFDGSDGNGGFKALMETSVIPGMTWPVDTSKSDDITSLMVSASVAFAPQITSFDSSYYQDDIFGIRRFHYVVGDTLTDDLSTYLLQHKSHMPFDSLGNWNNNIWSLWLSHNIDSLYVRDDNGTAARFTNMPKLLVSSSEAEFNYDEQMDAFMQFLNGNAIPYTHESFQGTSSYRIYDLLEDLLVFHSNHFGDISGAK